MLEASTESADDDADLSEALVDCDDPPAAHELLARAVAVLADATGEVDEVVCIGISGRLLASLHRSGLPPVLVALDSPT